MVVPQIVVLVVAGSSPVAYPTKVGGGLGTIPPIESPKFIEVWCNGSTPTLGVGVVAIDAREESHEITLLKYPETSIFGNGYLFVSNATRLKNVQSAL